MIEHTAHISAELYLSYTTKNPTKPAQRPVGTPKPQRPLETRAKGMQHKKHNQHAHKPADYTKKEPRHASNKELYAKLLGLRNAGIARGGLGPAGGLYSAALSALEKYPLPILGASQAEEILGFGPKVAIAAQTVADAKYKKYVDAGRQMRKAEAIARGLEEKEMEAKRTAQIKKETVRVKVLNPVTGSEQDMGYRRLLPDEPKLYTRESCVLAALYKTGEVQVPRKVLEKASESLWREEIGGKDLRFKAAVAELINRGFLEVYEGETEEEFEPTPEGAAIGKYHNYLYDGGLQVAGDTIPLEYQFQKKREDTSSEQSSSVPIKKPQEQAPKKETISAKFKDLFAGKAKIDDLKALQIPIRAKITAVSNGPEDIEDEEPPIDKLTNQTKPPNKPWEFKLTYSKTSFPAELQVDPNDLLPISGPQTSTSTAPNPSGDNKISSSSVFLSAASAESKSLSSKKPLFHSLADSFAPAGHSPASRWDPLTIPMSKIHTLQILLLIDIREKKSNLTEQKSGYFKDKLQTFGICCETASLPVGDFLWVLEVEDIDGRKYRGPLELIVERKYITDLAASLNDGRWEEQKARLKMSGIKQVVYIIEGDIRQNKTDQMHLVNAMASMKIFNKFSLVKTQDVDSTVKVLASMHTSVVEHWNRLQSSSEQSDKLTLACDLDQFCKSIKRSDVITPAAVFLQSLRYISKLGQLSVNVIETMARCFREMYEWCNGEGSEHRLAVMQAKISNRNIFSKLEAIFVKRRGWAVSK